MVALPQGALAVDIPNAAQPTAGQGLTLDLTGQLPLAVRQLLSGYEIAYAKITSTVSSTTATEASPLDVVAMAGALYFDGSPIWVEFGAASIANGGASSGGLNVWEDSTDKGRLFDTNGSTVSVGGVFRMRVTPSIGYHTYKVRLWTAGGTNFQVACDVGGAGKRGPAYILVTKA